MTLNYGIFDSADPASPDRTYTATLLSRILSKYLSNGVVSGDLNELKVSVTDPPAMTVVVATGTAIVQGRFIENDAALTLNVSAAHATYPRIDRVVVRLSAVTARTVDIAVKAGTAASSPVAPELTQTTDVYEIPLAQIAVGAGVTSILTANITDQRVFPDMTNLFHAAVSMLSDLTIGGVVNVTGTLDVTGSVALHGQTTIDNMQADIAGTLTGGVVGYLLRKAVVSATTGTLVVPAGSSTGYNPTTINLNGNQTYAIVGNVQKCFYDNPCLIPVVFDDTSSWYNPPTNTYAKSYTAGGVLIDSITSTGTLNIYNASYIIITGGTGHQWQDTSNISGVTVANAYIDGGGLTV